MPVWYEYENVHAIKYELQVPVMWEWYEYTSIESEFHLSANGKEGQDGNREVGIEEESTCDRPIIAYSDFLLALKLRYWKLPIG